MQVVLFTAIVKKGTASFFLDKARQFGVPGGTILRAEGTVQSPILNLLGLHDSKREVLIMLVKQELEAKVHEVLEVECQLAKRGRGILFSHPVTSVAGSHLINMPFNKEDAFVKDYQLMVTIVDRGIGDEVVKLARQEGGQGATILHGRGLGAEKAAKLFNIQLEPEREIVLMVVESAKVTEITDKIERELNLSAPGKGICFTLDVNSATGMYDQLDSE